MNLKPLTLIIPIILSPSISHSQTNDQQATLSSNNSSIDFPRLTRMSYLLNNYSSENFKEYKQLCKLAKIEPKIDMTIFEVRNSTWCFPYERHITKNANGEFVQEVYLKKNSNGESDSRYSPRQYLYFSNDILTTIQE